MDGTGGGKNEAGWWGLNVGNRGDGFIWREECWHAERFITDYSTAYSWSGPERLMRKKREKEWETDEMRMKVAWGSARPDMHTNLTLIHAKYTDHVFEIKYTWMKDYSSKNISSLWVLKVLID